MTKYIFILTRALLGHQAYADNTCLVGGIETLNGNSQTLVVHGSELKNAVEPSDVHNAYYGKISGEISIDSSKELSKTAIYCHGTNDQDLSYISGYSQILVNMGKLIGETGYFMVGIPFSVCSSAVELLREGKDVKFSFRKAPNGSSNDFVVNNLCVLN